MEILTQAISYVQFHYPEYTYFPLTELPTNVLVIFRLAIERLWEENEITFQNRHREDQKVYEIIRRELWERRRRQKG